MVLFLFFVIKHIAPGIVEIPGSPQLQQKTGYGGWLWPDEVHPPLYGTLELVLIIPINFSFIQLTFYFDYPNFNSFHMCVCARMCVCYLPLS